MYQPKPFQGEEHRSFMWNGGPAAALLVHGFPGTAAELRPLAMALHQQGWTTRGLLLPGFGPEFETLFDRQQSEWSAALSQAATELKRLYSPVVLIGYSMGAALVLQTAVEQRPDGLILLAPFRRLGAAWQEWIGFLLKPFFRHVYPFRRSNFSDRQVRDTILTFFPGLDLAETRTQQWLRDLRVPVRVFEQLNQVGKIGLRVAPRVDTPTLLIQGLQDEVVRPEHSRALSQCFLGPVRYLEVASGHDLLNPHHAAWPLIQKTILEFADMVRQTAHQPMDPR
ncbi:MAG TPA: alpha/beta fold hydrolase [Anaerolineae bacterium]|nr:alpha/beta fold hydrolase [Anaerolineae bacterium]HMR64349.1 alpha/beta fold hydrolase [Anaerolineae bacterium]